MGIRRTDPGSRRGGGRRRTDAKPLLAWVGDAEERGTERERARKAGRRGLPFYPAWQGRFSTWTRGAAADTWQIISDGRMDGQAGAPTGVGLGWGPSVGGKAHQGWWIVVVDGEVSVWLCFAAVKLRNETCGHRRS